MWWWSGSFKARSSSLQDFPILADDLDSSSYQGANYAKFKGTASFSGTVAGSSSSSLQTWLNMGHACDLIISSPRMQIDICQWTEVSRTSLLGAVWGFLFGSQPMLFLSMFILPGDFPTTSTY
jgi:hypothetical protein